MIKIGFIGGPGAGKSTSAASVFAGCKHRGITVDLVQEYARDQFNRGWIPNGISDQYRILQAQRGKEDIVPDAIEVMLTDSPTMLSYFYAVKNNPINNVSDRMAIVPLYASFLEDMNKYDILVLLNRVKPYVNDGTRSQTAEESDEIFQEVKALLNLHGVAYVEMDGNDETIELILQMIEDMRE